MLLNRTLTKNGETKVNYREIKILISQINIIKMGTRVHGVCVCVCVCAQTHTRPWAYALVKGGDS